MIAGPPPLYGTCAILIPAMRFRSSPVRWFGLPVPPEAYEYSPGFAAFASAISSCTLLAGTDRGTTSMN
jgi:hypothetical protein